MTEPEREFLRQRIDQEVRDRFIREVGDKWHESNERQAAAWDRLYLRKELRSAKPGK
jgi:hypothetical protein